MGRNGRKLGDVVLLILDREEVQMWEKSFLQKVYKQRPNNARWIDKCLVGSIVVSIPACHAGDRGSIPRRRVLNFISTAVEWKCASADGASL